MSRFVEKAELKSLDSHCVENLSRIPFVKPNRVEPLTIVEGPDEARMLIKAEQEWLSIAADGNSAKLSDFVPGDFKQFEGNSTNGVSKTDWIGRVVGLTTQVENGVFKLVDPIVTLNGDTAVVKVGWSLVGTLNGRKFSSTINVTDKWQKRNGRWRVIERRL